MIQGMSNIRPRASRLLPIAAACAVALSGCNTYDGGLPWSADEYVYHSKAWRPYTISLIDTRTGETLWLADIPVDHTLKCNFTEGSGPNSYKPDLMTWGVFKTDVASSRPRNVLPVPPSSSRRLDVVIRPGPELPDSDPGRSPFTTPSQVFSQQTQPAGEAVSASNELETKTRPVPFVPITEPTSTPVSNDEPTPDEPPINIPD